MELSQELLDDFQKLIELRAEMEERIEEEIENGTEDYRRWVLSNVNKDLNPLFIMAEGDSWFRYGVGFAIIYQLERKLDVEILNLAKPGDEVRKMLSGKQRRRLKRELEDGPHEGLKYDFLLFSGGGNDLVGQDTFHRWLHDYEEGMSAAEVINHSTLGSARRLLEDGYRDLVSLRNDYSPSTNLLFHSYDYAYPNGKGVCGFGPWLRPGLIHRNVPEQLRKEVVRLFLVQFDSLLDDIANDSDRVTVVQTQGTLESESEWHNELHPKNDGFSLMADHFKNVIETHM